MIEVKDEKAGLDVNRELPGGWRWVRLGAVCDAQSGGTPSRRRLDYYDGGIPWAKIEDLTRAGMYIDSTSETITELGLQDSSARLFPPGTLLFAMYGASIGTMSIAQIDISTNQAILGCQCSSLLIPEFLWFWLSYIKPRLVALGAGGAQPNLNAAVVKSIEIPLPSFAEQQRITAILSEQMAAVEQARIAAEAQLEAARELLAAYLRAVFENSEAQRWPRKRLGEAGEITSGITLGRKLNKVKTRMVPYLRVANVKDGRLDLSDVYETQATEAEIEKCRLMFGDMLLTEGGDPDKLGRGTFWEEQIPECIHQNHIFRVRFDLDQFSPQFISAQIGSPYGKAYFLAHAKQTTGIATINQKVLAHFPLMTPPFSEQQHIATRMTEQLVEVERMCKALKTQLDAINKLPTCNLPSRFAPIVIKICPSLSVASPHQ